MSEYIGIILAIIFVVLFLLGKSSLRFTNDEHQMSFKFQYRLFFEEPDSPHSFKFDMKKKLVKVYIRDLRFDIPDVSLEKVEQLYKQLQWAEARDNSVQEVIKKIQTLQSTIEILQEQIQELNDKKIELENLVYVNGEIKTYADILSEIEKDAKIK